MCAGAQHPPFANACFQGVGQPGDIFLSGLGVLAAIQVALPGGEGGGAQGCDLQQLDAEAGVDAQLGEALAQQAGAVGHIAHRGCHAGLVMRGVAIALNEGQPQAPGTTTLGGKLGA